MKNIPTGRTIQHAALASCAALLLGVSAPVQAAEDPGVQRAASASVRAARRSAARPQRREAVPVRATGRYHGAQVASAELQEMRGGFIGRSGLVVRFGFEIATHVNGALTQRLVLADTNIAPNLPGVTLQRTAANGATTSETITRQNLAQAPAEFREVLNGGATTVSTSLSTSGIVSAIQNSANNQLIQRTATINLEVIGLRNSMNSNAAGRFVNNALAARAVFGR
jgi:hypothetical protein